MMTKQANYNKAKIKIKKERDFRKMTYKKY